jgi:hypothetical protein
MANSTTNLDTISSSQAAKEVTANALFDAASPATLYGRRGSTSAGLTWGYYGGPMLVDGALTTIANGTVALTTAATNYVEASRTGTVSANTTAFTPGRVALYTVIAGASTVTSYTDHRPWASANGVGSRASVNAAGSGSLTLNAAATRAPAIVLTGALTGNRDVIVPDGPQQWTITNSTSGAFTITIKTAAGTGELLAAGETGLFLADGTNVVIASSAGSGLPNLSDAVNIATPNSSIPVISLTPDNAATNADLALLPKGAGALLADISDNALSGGNKRGSQAVDLQMVRGSASQVASGATSVIAGGSGNTASGQYGAVGGGLNNTCANTGAAIAGGAENSTSSNYATVLGGYGNTASGEYSAAMGYSSTTRGMVGALSHAAGVVSGGASDVQYFRAVIGRLTTNATTTVLTAGGQSPNTSNTLVLPNASALTVQGLVVGREDATGDTISWKFDAHIRRGANAASTAMVAACTPVQIAADAGASTWTLAVDANTTDGSLRLQVTGQASHTIKWGAVLSCTQVVG